MEIIPIGWETFKDNRTQKEGKSVNRARLMGKSAQ